jgi:hypothetical protein
LISGLRDVLRDMGSFLPRRCCSASTAASNRSNSWSVSCFIPPLRSLGSKYRDEEAAPAPSLVDGAGGGGFADDAEDSRNDAVENKSASIGRVRLLTITAMMPPPTSGSNRITALCSVQMVVDLKEKSPEPTRDRLSRSDSLLCVSDSLIARKFSLLWRLGNSVGKGLNFLPKAEAPWLSRARNRRISLYFPLEQGTHGRRPVRC